MFDAHPEFQQPDNEAVKIWRYMDFTKFVSLIESQKLFFTRADRFDDPFEGSYPRINALARQMIPDSVEPEHRENFAKAMQVSSAIAKDWKRFVAVNCWHMNEHESAAMWKLYLKSDEGIAVQSTYAKLKASLIDKETVYIGTVKYIDYEKDVLPMGNLFTPFVYKRKSFEHEREIRALVSKFPKSSFNGLDMGPDTIDGGLKLEVDLVCLIERVYVAPSAPSWFADLVRAVAERYGHSFEVVQSNLAQQPVF